MKTAREKCAEYEGKASLTRQHGLKLEDLIESSDSKLEDAEKRGSQLELLLEIGKYKIQELEEQINTLENKCGEADDNFTKHSNEVLELETIIKALHPNISILEAALQLETVKENDITESLKMTTEEKVILGD